MEVSILRMPREPAEGLKCKIISKPKLKLINKNYQENSVKSERIFSKKNRLFMIC